MAKRKSKKFTTAAGKVVVIKQSAPLARRRSTTRAIVVRTEKRHHHRRRHGGGGIGGILGGVQTHAQIIAPGTAGYIVGTMEKNGLFDKVPDIPMVGDLLGKKGSALLIIHVLKPQATGIVRDIKIFLGGLCGYELAKDDHISG